MVQERTLNTLLKKEDVAAPPPRKRLGTLTSTLVPARSSPSAVSCVVSWLNGGAVFRWLRRFVYAHIPRRQREGQGSRWGGLPTFAVVLADVLVGFRVVGVVVAISGVRSRSYLHLLAVNG